MLSSFKVLKLNEQIMIWLRIYNHHSFVEMANSFSFVMYCISLDLFAFIVSSAVFVYQNTSNIISALRATMVGMGSIQALGMFLYVVWNIDRSKLLHRKLQAFVDQAAKGKNAKEIWISLLKFILRAFAWLTLDGPSHMTEIYWATEQKCHRSSRLLLDYMFLSLSACVTSFNYAMYCICAGNMDTSTWNLPFNLVVPFDTESPWGWLLFWLFQSSTAISYTLCMIVPSMHFVGFCRYIVAICKHFELLADAIGLEVEQFQRSTKNRQKHLDMWHRIREKLSQLIDHHVNVLELVFWTNFIHAFLSLLNFHSFQFHFLFQVSSIWWQI